VGQALNEDVAFVSFEQPQSSFLVVRADEER
jgi:hypothetical protein